MSKVTEPQLDGRPDKTNKENPVVVGVLLQRVQNMSWNIGERICVSPVVAKQGAEAKAFLPYSAPVLPSDVKKAGGLDAFFKANPSAILANQPAKLKHVEPRKPKAERREK